MLHPIDLAVVLAWLLLTLWLGVRFSAAASHSTASFFVSDRSLPWWAVGTSMVATTFAADTPLVIAGLTVGGLHGNWFWWTAGLGGLLSLFYFARLWRRALVLTDAELVELRYAGPAARALRGLKGLWFGVFINVLVIAWVIRAMTKVTTVVLGITPDTALFTALTVPITAEVLIVAGLFVLTAAYTSAAGMYGVVATDVVQFVVAMIAAFGFAALCWVEVGGLSGLQGGFAAQGFDWSALTRLLVLDDPDPAGPTASFLVLVGIVWWSQRNADGGGYLAQRLFSARDDRHAYWAQLWFTVALLCLRPWPWVVVGMAGMVVFGPIADPELYYPQMMVEVLPVGLFGVMIASFLAAFMSTVDTQLHWGASLMINDVWQRFVRPDADERHHVAASRVAVVLLALIGAVVSFGIGHIEGAWKLAISVTAGLGSVYVARWYWWRVTAWCEGAAMIVAAACTYGFSLLAAHHPDRVAEGVTAWGWLGDVPQAWLAFPFSAGATALIVIAAWVPVALLTAPDPADAAAVAHLRRFYQRTRPGGPGWRAIAGDLPGFPADGPGWSTLYALVVSAAAVYGWLLGSGQVLVGRWSAAGASLAVAVIATALAVRAIAREVGDVTEITPREATEAR